MQKLTIISGLKQEGKTRELFDSYKEHFLSSTIHEDGIAMLNRLLIRPVFITSTNENPIRDYCSTLITSGYIGDNEMPFVTETHKYYSEVKEKGELFNIMTSNIKEGDCTFYLDSMDAVATINDLLEFMDSFPSDVSTNSCDIVITNTRNGSLKINKDTLYVKLNKDKELYVTSIIQGNPILCKVANPSNVSKGTHLSQVLISLGYDESVHKNLLFTPSAVKKIRSEVIAGSIAFNIVE